MAPVECSLQLVSCSPLSPCKWYAWNQQTCSLSTQHCLNSFNKTIWEVSHSAGAGENAVISSVSWWYIIEAVVMPCVRALFLSCEHALIFVCAWGRIFYERDVTHRSGGGDWISDPDWICRHPGSPKANCTEKINADEKINRKPPLNHHDRITQWIITMIYFEMVRL